MSAKKPVNDTILMSFQIVIRDFGNTYSIIRERLPTKSLEKVAQHKNIAASWSEGRETTVDEDQNAVRRAENKERDQLRAVRRVLYAAAYSAAEQFLKLIIDPPAKLIEDEAHKPSCLHVRMKWRLEQRIGQNLTDANLAGDWSRLQTIRRIRNLILHEAGLVIDLDESTMKKIKGGELVGYGVEPLFQNATTKVIVIYEQKFDDEIAFLSALCQRIWDAIYLAEKQDP